MTISTWRTGLGAPLALMFLCLAWSRLGAETATTPAATPSANPVATPSATPPPPAPAPAPGPQVDHGMPGPDSGHPEKGGTGFQDDAVARATVLLQQDQPAEAEVLLQRYLVYRPDDTQAQQLLVQAHISDLEAKIRVLLSQESKTKELIVGDPDYEAARARVDKAVANRLDVVEAFVAQGRYTEAVGACNAILEDYPRNTAAMILKLHVLEQLRRSVEAERGVMLKEHGVGDERANNETIRDTIWPAEKPKVARDVFLFDEDIAADERARLKARLQERIDLIQNGADVRKVIETLFAVTGINYIIVDSALTSQTLTIHLVHETVDTALSVIAKQVHIQYNYSSGTVYISSADTDVFETRIIRLSAGLTDVLMQPKLPSLATTQTQTNGAPGGPGGPGGIAGLAANGLNAQNQNPINQLANAFGGGGRGGRGGGAGGAGGAGGQGANQFAMTFNSDIQRFIDKIPDIVVDWPATGQIYLEPKSNTVFVKATPAAIDEVERLLHAMDYESVQVRIEAQFIEVDEDAARELGLDWNSISGGKGNFSYNGSMNNGAADVVPGTDAGAGLTTTILGSPAHFPAFNATLHALEQRGKANTLAKPEILTLNNAIGLIELTNDIAYISGYTTQSQTTNGTPSGSVGTVITNTSTVEVPQVAISQEGIQLQIRPSVARNSDMVTLDISPVVKQFTTFKEVAFSYVPSTTSSPLAVPNIEIPQFDTRTLSTLLHVQNGQTVALGGLVREQDSTNRTGLPFLSRVPALGLLFSRDSKSSERHNLVILVTAHIIDPSGARVSADVRALRDTAQVVLPASVRADLERQALEPDVPTAAAAPGHGATTSGDSAASSGDHPWDRSRGR